MTALYLLAAEYQGAARQLAELDLPADVVRDTLDSLSGDLETKAQAVAYMCRSLDADAAAVKQWAKDAADRAKALEARSEALREYLSRTLLACGITKITGPGITISFRASSAVVVDEPALVPQEFMRVPEPPPPAPDKHAMAEALRSGATIPGAHLETRKNLVIK